MGVLSRATAESWQRWGEPRSTWQRYAACRGYDLWTFYPEAHESFAQARSICSTCLVLEDCRKLADRAEHKLPARMVHGMFCGESPAERVGEAAPNQD